jgi:hypothetical protein
MFPVEMESFLVEQDSSPVEMESFLVGSDSFPVEPVSFSVEPDSFLPARDAPASRRSERPNDMLLMCARYSQYLPV